MPRMTSFSDGLKRLLRKDQIDFVDRLIRESNLAAERALEEERKARGPAGAALAAVQVAADVDTRLKEAEALSKIAKAAAKPAKKSTASYETGVKSRLSTVSSGG